MSSSPTSNSTSTDNSKAAILGDSDSAGSGGGGRSAVIARLKDITLVPNPSSPTIPHIPPPVWGHVLDFMPYEEVRSALFVVKIIAIEAVKYVRTLNFMKGYQLDVPSARRFTSVEEGNCLCLVSGQRNSTVLCRDTTLRLVSLLTMFPKIRRFYVGGLLTDEDVNGQLVRHPYLPSFCSSPENHTEMVKSLCYSLLGAFKARLLPQELNSKGSIISLFVSLHVCQGNGNRSGDTLCETCADICSCLPMQEIVQQPYVCNCAEESVLFEAIAKREGARKVFRDCSELRLNEFLWIHRRRHTVNNTEAEEEVLRRRLADRGVRAEEPRVCFMQTSDLVNLDRLIAVGFDPKMLSKEDLYGIMDIGADDRQFDVYAKLTFDALVARGFAFDESDLIVLDERMEPALKDVPALIRGEN